MAETIRFTPGQPETVALRFPEGKSVRGKFGDQIMYSTVDGRAFYLDPEPARDVENEIAELGIRTGEPFQLTKVRTTHGGSRFTVGRIEFEASRAASNGNGHNGNGHNGHNGNGHNGNIPSEPPAPAAPATITSNTARMMACFMSAIDAVAEAQQYATRRGLGITFTPENITSAALSCYINECRGGR